MPEGNLRDTDLYLAGSFNSWNPKDPHYCFQKDSEGIYFFQAELSAGDYEFKVTKGSWERVECNASGADIQNRMLKLTSDTVVRLIIENWKDRFTRKPRISTATRNVHVLDTAFLIPELQRVRRICIYLPVGYGASRQHYPVLYMQDGQNVFDDSTSFAGEWGVDETLDSLGAHRKQIIVVAIDNGGVKRINEYCPYDMQNYGKGEGDRYIEFLVNTLKPFVDKNYRTLKGKQNTFIAGSSMGGLISMYALLKYPKVFGGAGVFSPAFWVGPGIFDDINTKGAQVNSKIYFYCGGQEGGRMEPDMIKAFEEMRAVSKSKMISSVNPEGKHSEKYWREEFPLFYLWLIEK